ncbi:hypothetical protein PIB30_064441, partial [Stylosanthes scabra]|nr:hypothetical protein [Stylosanthes scabra]
TLGPLPEEPLPNFLLLRRSGTSFFFTVASAIAPDPVSALASRSHHCLPLLPVPPSKSRSPRLLPYAPLPRSPRSCRWSPLQATEPLLLELSFNAEGFSQLNVLRLIQLNELD